MRLVSLSMRLRVCTKKSLSLLRYLASKDMFAPPLVKSWTRRRPLKGLQFASIQYNHITICSCGGPSNLISYLLSFASNPSYASCTLRISSHS